MKTIKLLLATAALGLLTFTASAQSWLTNSLVAYYPFNGDANDASGNGNDLKTVNVSFGYNRFGNPNSAISFDGTSSYGVVTNFFSGKGVVYSYSVWFKPNHDITVSSSPEFVLIMATTGSSNDGGDLKAGLSGPPGPNNGPVIGNPFGLGGYKYFDTAIYNFATLTNQSFHSNTWVNLILVFEQSKMSVYLNGTFSGLTTYTTGSQQALSNLNVGAHKWDYGTGISSIFDGAMDEIRIYNRALSTNEVAQLYALESAPIISVQKAVYLTSSNLWAGTNYQVQASTDLINWTNQGSVFTAATNSWQSTNYWPVSDWNQLYFRLQQQ